MLILNIDHATNVPNKFGCAVKSVITQNDLRATHKNSLQSGRCESFSGLRRQLKNVLTQVRRLKRQLTFTGTRLPVQQIVPERFKSEGLQKGLK